MTMPGLSTTNKLNATLHDHWKAFLIEGVLLMVMGLAALLLPRLASIATTVFLGWLFLISGAVGLAVTLWARAMNGFWWSLVSAALALIAGVILIARPLQGTVTLTLVLAGYFIAEGFASIMYGVNHRQTMPRSWVWMIAAGLVDFGVAIMIILGLPESAEWAIGLLVGINLLFGGSSLIAMALAARNGGRQITGRTP